MTYSAPDSVVRVRTQRSAAAFILDVHNEGPAISEETMPTLFEPFRRAGDRAGAPGNIGLGLFIVREIVRAHGGEIAVRSGADEGTTFTVTLPIAPTTR
jgi:signal transduction histidine kinase